MKYLLLLYIILFSINTSFGQFRYQNYEMGKPLPFPKEDTSAQKIILLKKKIVEYGFEHGNFIQVDVIHVAEYLRTAEAVEQNNRKYLPFSNNSIVIDPQARVVAPDGSIIYLDESKVLESVDAQSGNHYRYFAFEGLEPGSIVEYLYVVKSHPRFDGKQEFVQTEYPVAKYEFDLYCPADFSFDFKTYNTSIVFEEENSGLEYNHYFIRLDSISNLKKEFQAPLETLFIQFAYKMDKYGQESSYINYAKASTSIYQQLSSVLTKSERKDLRKLLKISGALNAVSTDDKIFALEFYIKSNVRLSQKIAKGGENLSQIIKRKTANEHGLVRLYYHALQQLGIDAEFALTCDRTLYAFDPQFQSYHFLNHYLIYIPQSDKFFDPSVFAYRYGMIPAEYTDTYGLFIKEKKVADFSAGIGKVRYIDPLPFDETYSILDVSIVLNEDFSDASVEVSSKTNGYYSVYIQPYLEILNAKQRDEIISAETNRLFPGSDVSNLAILNGQGSQSGRNPLIVNYKLSNTGMVEHAGDKYLIKIGETIGKQLELYSENSRTLPVHSNHKRMYERTISFAIPDGMRISNLSDLEIIASYGDAEKLSLSFSSKASIEGNMLTVKVKEYYDQLSFTAEEYEYYRKVINSASDFNKAVLILEHIN